MITEIRNFGKSRYSCGMELVVIVASSAREILASNEYFFNPAAPCDLFHDDEWYAVKGTPEQYKEFYTLQKRALIASRIVDHFGDLTSVPLKEYNAVKRKYEEEYEDWWEIPTDVATYIYTVVRGYEKVSHGNCMRRDLKDFKKRIAKIYPAPEYSVSWYKGIGID